MQHIFLDSISSTLRFAGIPFFSIPFSSTFPLQNTKNSDGSLCGWNFRTSINFMAAVTGRGFFCQCIKERIVLRKYKFPMMVVNFLGGK